MILRHLRYFLAAANEGSLAGASRKMRVAQPALARQVHALEARLGAKLFHADARGIRLTAAGDELARRGRELLVQLDIAAQRARLAHDGWLGTVHLGLGRMALDSTLLSRALTEVRDALPHVNLVTREVNTLDQVPALLEGSIDVAIGLGTGDEDGAIATIPLYEEPMDTAVLNERHPLAGSASVNFGDLGALPLQLVERADNAPVSALVRALRARATGPCNAHLNIESAVAFVAAGQGWTVMPRSFRSRPPAGTAVVRLQDFSFAFTVAALRRRHDRHALVSNVCAALAAVCRGEVLPAKTVAVSSGITGDGHAFATDAELREVLALVAVIEEGSVSQGARRLGVTPSGISRQLAALERKVGAVLLERRGRATVTVAGREFYAAAREPLAEFQRYREGPVEEASARTQCILGVVPSELAGPVLSRAVQRVQELEPWVRLRIREVLTPEQLPALRANEIDLGIAGTFPGSDRDPAVSVMQLAEDVVDTALFPAAHPLAGRTAVGAAELASYPFVFVSRDVYPMLYDMVVGALTAAGIAPRDWIVANGPRAIWSSVAGGSGWTLGTSGMRARPPAGLAGVQLLGLRLPAPIYLLARRDEASGAVRAVLSQIRAAAEDLTPQREALPT